MFTEFFIFFASVALVFYIWQNRFYSYWQRNGVKSIKPEPIFGNIRSFLTGKVPFFEQISLFHTAKGFENEPLIGVYFLKGPGVIVRDLDLVKTVMIKKFNYFVNRAMKTDPIHDSLGYNNLLLSRSPDWKGLRNKISPVFTSGKIKQMYPLMVDIGKDLEDNLAKMPDNSVVRIKDKCARFTIDLVASIAFGIKANALKMDNSEFFKVNTEFFKLSLKTLLDSFCIFLLPSLASLVHAKMFPKPTRDFFIRTISYVLDEREKSGVQRNDLVDVLLAMKRETKSQKNDFNNKDLEFLVAQAALFQTAGFETSSSTMTMTLFELVHNTAIQDRLRSEIKEYFGDEDHISYERLQEMPYLCQVVNETLRKYPIAGYVERECAQPESGEKFTLQPYYDLEVPNGMPFYVSTLAIQRDEKYWPDPEKYDPDRFAPENRDKINMDAYMPFGIGPRNCIGMRLGLLQAKLGLVHLLRKHSVTKCDETVDSFKFEVKSPLMASNVDIYVRLQKD
ncbi:probable cytochrome P450 6w1 [Drosophila sulfurigaster albostrigata]|uniref:probable cytochrome P450 6w1 n=1 Tax=Drosophila sulfurigaster albostrigata TaxID=89887 RepID=UPI002D21CA22|nr:probable cytochrome P450 6w1 [Drosophila sulfurigaster albostrigata]